MVFSTRRATLEDIDEPDHADHRRGVDVAATGLVVEADVATDDGDVERPGRFGHAVDRLRELPHHLGVLRVAEVEAVDQGDRPGPGARHIEGRLGHDESRAPSRVEGAPPGIAVGAQGDGACARRQARRLEPEDGGIAARLLDGVEEQLMVVLTPDP